MILIDFWGFYQCILLIGDLTILKLELIYLKTQWRFLLFNWVFSSEQIRGIGWFEDIGTRLRLK